MAWWSWWLRILGRADSGNEKELARVREKVFLLEQESNSVARELKDIASRRELYMRNLREAEKEEDARIWASRLRGLDTEEQGLRARWNQVEGELQQYRTALVNLKTMRRVNLRKVEQELEHLTRLQEERARQNQALQERQQEIRQRQELAFATYQHAVERQEPDPYMALWQKRRALGEQRPEPEPQREKPQQA